MLLALQVLANLLLTIITLTIEVIAFTGIITIGVITIGVIIMAVENKLNKNKRRRFNMNAVKKLLAVDVGKIKTPTKDVEMKLQKLGGEKFIFPCKAVDPEYISELQENALEFSDSELSKIRVYDTKVMTIIEGCPEVFKNDEVIKHFNAVTPKDLIKILMLSGEMDELKLEIDRLGGYDKKKSKKKTDEVKN